MPYDLIQGQGMKYAKMADCKSHLLHQYACNQKPNGEFSYSKIISKF